MRFCVTHNSVSEQRNVAQDCVTKTFRRMRKDGLQPQNVRASACKGSKSHYIAEILNQSAPSQAISLEEATTAQIVDRLVKKTKTESMGAREIGLLKQIIAGCEQPDPN